ncbi:hypothetical protein WN51_13583 [Melipona quadrifasciata]|uniref:Uncharacterized protein n=1 Tax=Melipona quadrifasciata TaxID=166423 RepID=A0A0N0U5H4_9HYME|nr:hypothetical protein WN51_13583 [Melipona quadrifasciata]
MSLYLTSITVALVSKAVKQSRDIKFNLSGRQLPNLSTVEKVLMINKLNRKKDVIDSSNVKFRWANSPGLENTEKREKLVYPGEFIINAQYTIDYARIQVTGAGNKKRNVKLAMESHGSSARAYLAIREILFHTRDDYNASELASSRCNLIDPFRVPLRNLLRRPDGTSVLWIR